MNNLRIAFWGTPDFVTQFLDTLEEAKHTPELIITGQDARSGRGLEVKIPEPKLWAEKRNISILQPEIIDDAFITELEKTPWDLFVVIAYGKILPKKIIDLPRLGTINVHYSLLPKYRGATPVESAILNGETETGVCIQKMKQKLDSGPILMQEKISILASDTTPTLRQKLNEKAKEMLPFVIEGLQNETIKAIDQDDSQKTLCGKMTKEDGEISLSDNPITIDRKLRAYTPWPGIYFFAEKSGKRIRVRITQGSLIQGKFIPEKVIPEGKKEMAFEDFKRGLK